VVTAPSGLMTSVAMRLQDGGAGELTGSVCWAEVGRYEVRALLEQEWVANSGMQVFAIPLQDDVSTANSAADANDGVLRLTAGDSKSLANNRLSFSLSSQRHAPAAVNSAAHPNPGFGSDLAGGPIGVGIPVVSTPRQRRPSAALSTAPSLALAALGAAATPASSLAPVTANALAPASRLVTTASAQGATAGVMMPQPNLSSSARAAAANTSTTTPTPSTQQPLVMPKLDLSAITAAAADHGGTGPTQVLSLSSLSGLTAGGLLRRYGTGSVVSSRMSDVSSLPGGSPRTARSGRHSHRYIQV
jgi:hypothetical protein